MNYELSPFFLKTANRVRRAYWSVVKPERFGVKVLVVHPEDDSQFLAIRQSYGNTELFTLPGGGYKPKSETVFEAAKREVLEEVGITLLSKPKILVETLSTEEGKRDNLTIVGAVAVSADVVISSELLEATWSNMDLRELPENYVSRFAKQAIQAYTALER